MPQGADYLPLHTATPPGVEGPGQGPWSAAAGISAVDAAAWGDHGIGTGGSHAAMGHLPGLGGPPHAPVDQWGPDLWGAGSEMSFDDGDGESEEEEEEDPLALGEAALQAAPMPPPRPHFARKVACWTGAHDFVQSILMLAGGVVVSGGDSGFVRLHRIGEHDEAPISLHGHSGAVMCLDAPCTDPGGGGAADAPASSTIFSGSVDHTVGKWDIGAGGVRTATLEGHARSVHCLALGHGSGASAGDNILLTGSRDHTIKVWDLRTHACEHTLSGHTGSVTCIGSHGWRLVSGGGYNRGVDDDEVLSVDTSLKLWDLRRLGARGRTAPVWSRQAPSPTEPPQPFGQQPPGDPVLSLQLTESKLLTSHGGKQWTARIWDLATEC